MLAKHLTHHSGFVRKASAAILRMPRLLARLRAKDAHYSRRPPVLVNSFPKSGTHLLLQLAEGLPERVNYGAFLASMTSSFQFRQRSPESTGRFIRSFVPGEIIRGHLFYDPRNAEDLVGKNVVHYFIYRDPRDVVVSEAHYLREMNRWHRLAPFFRKVPSIDDAITLSIAGFDPPIPGIEYPNIAGRFARYQGWLSCDECLCIRFEDLRSEARDDIVRRMAEFYLARCEDATVSVDECVRSMTARIAPHKSHTFRSGKKAGWQQEFNAEHRRLFDELAGDLLVELGYESNHDWASAPVAATA